MLDCSSLPQSRRYDNQCCRSRPRLKFWVTLWIIIQCNAVCFALEQNGTSDNLVSAKNHLNDTNYQGKLSTRQQNSSKSSGQAENKTKGENGDGRKGDVISNVTNYQNNSKVVNKTTTNVTVNDTLNSTKHDRKNNQTISSPKSSMTITKNNHSTKTRLSDEEHITNLTKAKLNGTSVVSSADNNQSKEAELGTFSADPKDAIQVASAEVKVDAEVVVLRGEPNTTQPKQLKINSTAIKQVDSKAEGTNETLNRTNFERTNATANGTKTIRNDTNVKFKTTVESSSQPSHTVTNATTDPVTSNVKVTTYTSGLPKGEEDRPPQNASGGIQTPDKETILAHVDDNNSNKENNVTELVKPLTNDKLDIIINATKVGTKANTTLSNITDTEGVRNDVIDSKADSSRVDATKENLVNTKAAEEPPKTNPGPKKGSLADFFNKVNQKNPPPPSASTSRSAATRQEFSQRQAQQAAYQEATAVLESMVKVEPKKVAEDTSDSAKSYSGMWGRFQHEYDVKQILSEDTEQAPPQATKPTNREDQIDPSLRSRKLSDSADKDAVPGIDSVSREDAKRVADDLPKVLAKVKSVNAEFVEGLDDINKFFEGVDPPDELDVGAGGSSIQEALVGKGAQIVTKRVVQGLRNIRKALVDARDQLASRLKRESGALVTRDEVLKGFQQIGKACRHAIQIFRDLVGELFGELWSDDELDDEDILDMAFGDKKADGDLLKFSQKVLKSSPESLPDKADDRQRVRSKSRQDTASSGIDDEESVEELIRRIRLRNTQ